MILSDIESRSYFCSFVCGQDTQQIIGAFSGSHSLSIYFNFLPSIIIELNIYIYIKQKQWATNGIYIYIYISIDIFKKNLKKIVMSLLGFSKSFSSRKFHTPNK